MRKAAVLLLLFALTACGGGGGDSADIEYQPEARFEIISVDKTTFSTGHPSLMITVKNTGDATGYNVGCDAQALDAAGTIIDTAPAFFAGLGNIDAGQTAQDEAVFFKLASHDDYKTIEYDCSWLTRN